MTTFKKITTIKFKIKGLENPQILGETEQYVNVNFITNLIPFNDGNAFPDGTYITNVQTTTTSFYVKYSIEQILNALNT